MCVCVCVCVSSYHTLCVLIVCGVLETKASELSDISGLIFWCVLAEGPSGMDGMRWNERRAICPPFAPLHSFRKANRLREVHANTPNRRRVQCVWSVSLKPDAERCFNELAAGRWKLACIVWLRQMKYNQSQSPRPTFSPSKHTLHLLLHRPNRSTADYTQLQWVYTHFKTNSTLYYHCLLWTKRDTALYISAGSINVLFTW